MNVTEVLTRITPLPYRAPENEDTGPINVLTADGVSAIAGVNNCTCPNDQPADAQCKAYATYLAHAASVLPGLIEAVDGLLDAYCQGACECIAPEHPRHCPYCILRDRLAKAKEVSGI